MPDLQRHTTDLPELAPGVLDLTTPRSLSATECVDNSIKICSPVPAGHDHIIE